MLQPRVSDYVNDVRPIAQLVELIECEKAGSRKIGFLAKHSV
jgi:hypothetical protein